VPPGHSTRSWTIRSGRSAVPDSWSSESDLTVYAWDLARSIGVDDRIHPEPAELVLSVLERGVPGMTAGMPLGPESTESRQDRLLALTGRSLG
jgi:hypothetical protein